MAATSISLAALAAPDAAAPGSVASACRPASTSSWAVVIPLGAQPSSSCRRRARGAQGTARRRRWGGRDRVTGLPRRHGGASAAFLRDQGVRLPCDASITDLSLEPRASVWRETPLPPRSRVPVTGLRRPRAQPQPTDDGRESKSCGRASAHGSDAHAGCEDCFASGHCAGVDLAPARYVRMSDAYDLYQLGRARLRGRERPRRQPSRSRRRGGSSPKGIDPRGARDRLLPNDGLGGRPRESSGRWWSCLAGR